VGGHHRHARVADPGREYLGGPVRRAAPVADPQQGPDQRTHHVVTEGVRHHRRHHQRPPGRGGDGQGIRRRGGGHVTRGWRGPCPVQAEQRADRACSLAAAAERGEVMLAQAGARRLVHGGDVQRTWVPQRAVTAERVSACGIVTDPVAVTPPRRRKPRVEPRGGRRQPGYPHIGRQRAAQPVPCGAVRGFPAGGGHVAVSHLAACVDARVRPPGHGQRGWSWEREHTAQRLLKYLLDGPPARLACPAGKPAAVVGDLQPQPQQPLTYSPGHPRPQPFTPRPFTRCPSRRGLPRSGSGRHRHQLPPAASGPAGQDQVRPAPAPAGQDRVGRVLAGNGERTRHEGAAPWNHACRAAG
jgi:hypothetical protein